MTQMSLGLDLPSKEELAHRAKLSSLPDSDEALIEEARNLLTQYHDAMLDADGDLATDIQKRIEAVGEKMNGGTRFGIVTDEGAYGRLIPLLSAPDGQEPMYGQPGRFVVTALGCRCAISTKGLFGFGGFEVRAIDFGRPFISQTGFRSFTGSVPIKKGDRLSGRVIRQIENSGEKLVRIGPRVRWIDGNAVKEPAGPDLEDPAWQPGGWLHELTQSPPPLAMGG